MVIRQRDFSEMVNDGISFLTANTDITYITQGSMARALIDAPMLELSRLQDFVMTNFDNAFLSNATGPFLDVIADGLGLVRREPRSAIVLKEDGAIRFFVRNGTLGQRLPDPLDSTKGLIPNGTVISNSDGSVEYAVGEDVQFPLNAKSVFVPALAINTGSGSLIGPGHLTVHTLGIADVFVTNDIAIATGADEETDENFRFRISRAFSTRFSNNSTSVQVAATSIVGVIQANLIEFARGAGTFDVLLIPRGNKLPSSIKDEAFRAISEVTAYGISVKVREPDFIAIKITLRLRFVPDIGDGSRDIVRDSVQTSILGYIASIPMGGEFIINQLRNAVLTASDLIVDMTLLEICIDGKQNAIRNHKLSVDELFTPDTENEAVLII